MNYKFRLIFIALIFSLASKLTAQHSYNRDSLTICKTISKFFNWYIDAIKQNKYSEFQPVFVETKNGKTTLSFTGYVNNLAKYKFSNSLITNEKLSYQDCIDELGKINYKDFKAKSADLDDFENIECDFSNSYRWTGGQEPIDGIRIKAVTLINSYSATVVVEYFNYNSDKKKNFYWGRNIVTMKKSKNTWLIDNINWK